MSQRYLSDAFNIKIDTPYKNKGLGRERSAIMIILITLAISAPSQWGNTDYPFKKYNRNWVPRFTNLSSALISRITFHGIDWKAQKKRGKVLHFAPAISYVDRRQRFSRINWIIASSFSIVTILVSFTISIFIYFPNSTYNLVIQLLSLIEL